jgi:hypothetical protein
MFSGALVITLLVIFIKSLTFIQGIEKYVTFILCIHETFIQDIFLSVHSEI